MALYIVTSPNGIIDQDDALPFDVIADRELPDGWETLIETQMLPAALAAAIDQQHGHGLRDARPGLFANEEGGGVIVHADGTWSDVQTTHMVATVGSVSYTHLRAHETVLDLVCRLLLEKKKQDTSH